MLSKLNIRRTGHVILALFLLLFSIGSACQNVQENLARLIKLKKGFKYYPIPSSQLFVNTLSVMEPGLPLIALDGGLLMPAVKAWLIPPISPYIIACDQIISKTDTALELLRIDPVRKNVFLQKVSDLHKVDSKPPLCTIPFGWYDLKVSADNHSFIWGGDSVVSGVYVYNGTRLQTLYTSSRPVNDIDLLNNHNLLMAIDSSIVMIGFKQPPKSILKLDIGIDGIAVDTDGTMFVSTLKGILHFNSLDQDDVDVITHSMHGKIRIYRNRLFVLWKEQKEIIEIKLK